MFGKVVFPILVLGNATLPQPEEGILVPSSSRRIFYCRPPGQHEANNKPLLLEM